MYDYFNKTFWKKVDAYGRERMEKDLWILRSLRKNIPIYKPQSRPKKNRQDQALANVDNQKVYRQIQKNIDRKELMTDILFQKIRKEDLRLNDEQASKIAEYMIENDGGCPL